MISCHYSIRKAMDVTGVSIEGREKSVYLLFMRLKGVRDCIETVNYLERSEYVLYLCTFVGVIIKILRRYSWIQCRH